MNKTRYDKHFVWHVTNNADQCGAVVAAELVNGIAHIVIAIFNFYVHNNQRAICDAFVVIF